MKGVKKSGTHKIALFLLLNYFFLIIGL